MARMMENANKPTEWGPGSDGPVFSKSTGVWLLPLNATGRAVVDGFLKKYRHPEVCLASRKYKWLFDKASAMLGREEMRSVAYEGLIRAAIKYNPSLYPDADPESYTYIVNGIYQWMRRAVRKQAVGDARMPMVRDWSDGDSDLNVLNLIEDRPHADLHVDEGLLGKFWHRLYLRERVVLVGIYLCERTLKEIGTLLGVSRERIRQIELQALSRLRVWSSSTRDTSGDEAHGDRECPSKRRLARGR